MIPKKDNSARVQDARDISHGLARDIQRLCHEIFPNGKREGSEWCIGSLAGAPGRSLKINLAGKPGVWSDFSTGAAGDALDLVAQALHDGSMFHALAWSRRWLGGAQASVRHADAVKRPPVPVLKPKNDFWLRIWREAVHAGGSPVETYLQFRGLRWMPSLQSALRYHPACPRTGGALPAMVALMTDPATNEPRGIHRTFLKPDGRGKADVPQPKSMLGTYGVVRLSLDEDVTQGLGISEGIETGLAVLQHAGWAPIWAALNAGGVSTFPVLNGIGALTIFADNDLLNKGHHVGQEAARNCGLRWAADGRKAFISLPPSGRDWHQALTGRP